MPVGKRELLRRWRAIEVTDEKEISADPPYDWLCSCLKAIVWRKKTSPHWVCFVCHPPEDDADILIKYVSSAR